MPLLPEIDWVQLTLFSLFLTPVALFHIFVIIKVIKTKSSEWLGFRLFFPIVGLVIALIAISGMTFDSPIQDYKSWYGLACNCFAWCVLISAVTALFSVASLAIED